MDIVSLKNKINDLLLESTSSKKANQKEAKAAYLLLKETLFKEIYYAVDNLQNGVISDKEHIMENIRIIKNNIKYVPKKQYENFFVTNIDESINFLVNYKKSALTLNEFYEHIDRVQQHIVENKERMVNKKDYSLFVENLKKLPQEHYIIVEQLALAENKQDYFTKLKEEISSFITEEIQKCEVQDDKFLLYEAREKIANKEYDENTYVKNIIEMVKIKELIG
jgi:hypothetical protein